MMVEGVVLGGLLKQEAMSPVVPSALGPEGSGVCGIRLSLPAPSFC